MAFDFSIEKYIEKNLRRISVKLYANIDRMFRK